MFRDRKIFMRKNMKLKMQGANGKMQNRGVLVVFVRDE
jgi:hypothetical protein